MTSLRAASSVFPPPLSTRCHINANSRLGHVWGRLLYWMPGIMCTKSHRTRLYDLQFVCLKFIAVGVIFQATESILPSSETESVSNVCNYRGPRLPLKVPTVEGTRSETQTPHEGWTKYSFGCPSVHMSANTDVLSLWCRENLTSRWTATWCRDGNTV
jgi:hypothetical protein